MNLQCSIYFYLNSSPDVWFDAILSLSYIGSLFDLRAWFFYIYVYTQYFFCFHFDFYIIYLCEAKLNFSQPLLQSSVLHGAGRLLNIFFRKSDASLQDFCLISKKLKRTVFV